MKCDDCGKDGLTGAEMAYEVKGYERPRAQGGTNHIEAREQTGKMICGSCLVKRKAGINPSQTGLLG